MQGRFRDKFRDLIDFFANGVLCPYTKYGAVYCVSVMESTVNSKTRGLVIRELQMCVEACGLNGIGKKGMLIQAKLFSDEKMLENKGLHLDLIQTIISKMNNDSMRYFKLCGSTSLSRKAKEMIEKRMAKVASGHDLTDTSNAVRKPKIAQRSTSSGGQSSDVSNIGEDIVELNLRPIENADGPFKFSFGSDEPSTTSDLPEGSTDRNTSAQIPKEGSSGAAANLRERLRSIRDKHKQEGSITSPESKDLGSQTSAFPLFSDITDRVETLLGEPTPLLEVDEKFTKALVCLRQLHSSLSNNGNDSTGTDPQLLQDLRQHIMVNEVPLCVKMLTR